MNTRMPDLNPQDRLNATQAARALGISRETLRRHVAAGSIRRRFAQASLRPYYLGKDILSFWKKH